MAILIRVSSFRPSIQAFAFETPIVLHTKSRRHPLKRVKRRRAIAQLLEQVEHRHLLATFDISNPADAPVDLIVDTLREAILEHNTNDDSSNQIRLGAGTYSLGIDGTEDIGLAGDLDISRRFAPLLISGASDNPNDTIINGSRIDRVFDVFPWADVTLRNLTIMGGTTAGNGGGLRALNATVTLDNVVVRDNQTDGTGVDDFRGGGIHNAGSNSSLNLNDVSIVANAAHGHGGGIANVDGKVDVNNLFVSSNMVTAPDNEGGGIWQGGRGSTTLAGDVVVEDNVSFSHGGGIRNAQTSVIQGLTADSISIRRNIVQRDDRDGGGFHQDENAQLNLANVTLEDNIGGRRGGGFANYSGQGVTIHGGSISNNTTNAEDGGGFWNSDSGQVMLTDVQITNNQAAGRGGGFHQETATSDVTIVNGLISNNIANSRGMDGTIPGGGFYNGLGTVDLTNTPIDNNKTLGTSSSTNHGGGFWTVGVNSAVTITDGAITNNEAAGEGGGFWSVDTDVQFLLENNTTTPITGNKTQQDSDLVGGGFRLGGGGTTIIENPIIEANSATSHGGGFYADNNSSVVLRDASGVGGSITNNIAGDRSPDPNNLLTEADRHGGGFFNNGAGDVVLENIDIVGNIAGGGGGGFWNDQLRSTLTLTDGSVSQNISHGERGGGFVNNGNLEFVNSPVTFNERQGINGDPESVFGGGGFFTGNRDSKLVFDNSPIENNISYVGHGGGFWNIAGNVELLNGSNVAFNKTLSTNRRAGGFWNTDLGVVSISDGVIQGNTSQEHAGGFQNAGGGIVNLLRTPIIDNTSRLQGGGFLSEGGTSEVHIADGLIKGNVATDHGGGFSTRNLVTLTNTDITENQTVGEPGVNYVGGGFYSEGWAAHVKITDSSIYNNKAAGRGGGFYNSHGIIEMSATDTAKIANNETTQQAVDFGGGGFWASGEGAVSLVNIDVLDNSTFGHGAGMELRTATTFSMTNGRISGNQVLADDHNGGGVHAADDARLTLDNVEITNNSTGNIGGGLALHSTRLQTSITNSKIYNNITRGLHGGGISNSAKLSLENVELFNNRTNDNGQGAPNFHDGRLAIGGGLYNEGFNANVDLVNVRIYDNLAYGRGGGIYNSNGSVVGQAVDIRNNKATADDGVATNEMRGGGFWNSGTGQFTIDNTAAADFGIVGNFSKSHGGGFETRDNGWIQLTNVTVADNTSTLEGGGFFMDGSQTKMTMTGGAIRNNASLEGRGGGFSNRGNISLTDTIVEGNQTLSSAPDADDNRFGGGFFNAINGNITFSGGAISENKAAGPGGGFFNTDNGVVTLLSTPLRDNQVVSARRSGGGFWNSGTGIVNISGDGTAATGVTNNISSEHGGGLANRDNGVVNLTDVLVDGNATIHPTSTNSVGGAIYQEGPNTILNLNETTISNNRSMGNGAGIYNSNGTIRGDSVAIISNIVEETNGLGTALDARHGGGIWNSGEGDIELSKVSINDNIARRGGGFDNHDTGRVILLGGSIRGNMTQDNETPDHGGGFWNDGNGLIHLNDVNLTNNLSSLEGGGFFNVGNGRITIQGGSVDGNTALVHGGGFSNQGAEARVTLIDTKIRSNKAETSHAGGIRNVLGTVTATRTTIEANQTLGNDGENRVGGGIWNQDTGAILTLTDSHVTGNHAVGRGGGIFNSAGATLELIRSTVSGNSASADGGGIYQESDGTTLFAENSTLSGNQAGYNPISNQFFPASGGAMVNNGESTTTLRHTTIAFNKATTNGGGLFGAAGTLTIDNSLVVNNEADSDGDGTGQGNDLFGSVLQENANLLGEDLFLEPLAMNGGFAPSHALQLGNPAIDAAINSTTLVDQRNLERPASSQDLGALELAADTPFIEPQLPANTVTVNNPTDGLSGGTLREAIVAANNSSNDEIIELATGTYTLSLLGMDDDASAGDLDIIKRAGTLEIRGGSNNAADTVIDAAGIDRVFHVIGGPFGETNVTLRDLTITGGRVASHGGGFWNDNATVNLDNVIVSNNMTLAGGAGDSHGGGFFVNNNYAQMSISESRISNNSAFGHGGGFWNDRGSISIHDSEISDNSITAADHIGGGFWNSDKGEIQLSGDVVLDNNTSSGGGGGFWNRQHASVDGSQLSSISIQGNVVTRSDRDGAGFWNAESGDVTLANATIENNGGGSGFAPQGGRNGGGFQNQQHGTVSIQSGAIQFNRTGDSGGGFINVDFGKVDLTNVDISSNAAQNEGGGFWNSAPGEVSVTNGAISNNRALNRHGGGFSNRSKLTLNNTPITGNQTLGALAADNVGGGFYNTGQTALVHIIDGEVSGNTATGRGGGFYNQNGGEIVFSLENNIETKITDNHASSTDHHGGGFFNVGRALIEIPNPVIQDNTATGHGGGFVNEAASVVSLNSNNAWQFSNNKAGFAPDGTLQNTDRHGGGFSNRETGVVRMSGALLENNVASGGAGGFFNEQSTGVVTLVDGHISNNTAMTIHGGGFWNRGQVDLTRVDVTDNEVQGTGNLDRHGGGFFSEGGHSSVTLIDGNITGNSTYGHGAGFWNSAGTVDIRNTNPQVPLEISNNEVKATSRRAGGFWTAGRGVTKISDTVVQNNVATEFGGGFWVGDAGHVELNNVDVLNNSARRGGGFDTENPAASLKMTNGLIQGNVANGDDGGGFWTGSQVELTNVDIVANKTIGTGAENHEGGGFRVFGHEASVTIVDGDIINNETYGHGGGFYSDGQVTLRSTDPQNRAVIQGNVITQTDHLGGGFWNSTLGSVTLENVDILENIASNAGGGFNNEGGHVTISNSDIMRNKTGYQVATGNQRSDVDGAGFRQRGGGSFWQSAVATLDNVRIEDNQGARHGGGFVNSGVATKTILTNGSIANHTTSSHGSGFWNEGIVQLTDVPVTANKNVGFDGDDQRGAGFYNAGVASQVDLLRSPVSDNTSYGHGGGFWNEGSMNVVQSDIHDNRVESNIGDGGAFYNRHTGRIVVTESDVSRNSSLGNAGAILNAGTLDFSAGKIAGNTAAFRGGGIYSESQESVTIIRNAEITNNSTTEGFGGGIFNQGDATLENTIVQSNRTTHLADDNDFWGGGIVNLGSHATMRLADSMVLENESAGHGAGIWNQDAQIRIEDTGISDNKIITDLRHGGGLWNGGRHGFAELNNVRLDNNVSLDQGGGIMVVDDALTFVNGGSISGNQARFHGGGISQNTPRGKMYLDNVAVNGNSTTESHGGGVHNAGLLVATNSTFNNNFIQGQATDDRVGGGIWNRDNRAEIHLINSEVNGNQTFGRGAGIYNNNGTMFVTDSSISNNKVLADGRIGGGLWNSGTGDDASLGGSIFIERSLIANNSATEHGGGLVNIDAGAIMRISNSTISGNTATFDGGGLWNQLRTGLQPPRMELDHVTVAFNRANRDAGGIFAGNVDATFVSNSIVSNNAADADDDGTGSGNDIRTYSADHSLQSLGFNLVGDSNTTGVAVNFQLSDMLDVDPLLEPLADNGGPTLTHGLQVGSPAIDAIQLLDFTELDQRGAVRPLDGDEDGQPFADIGALEFGDLGDPPLVVSVVVNADLIDPPNRPSGAQPTSWLAQRSDIRTIVVTFTEEMQLLRPVDLVLTNLGVNAPGEPDANIAIDATQLSVVGETLTISFGPNELPDGVYQLEILDTAQSAEGLALDGDADGNAGGTFRYVGDAQNQFYKLHGEWATDGGVSIFDFPTFAYWFGVATPTAPEYADLNGDGGVTIFDFGLFAANFNTSVTFPPPARAAKGTQREARNQATSHDMAITELFEREQRLLSESRQVDDWLNELHNWNR